jgi:hypothetical protein
MCCCWGPTHCASVRCLRACLFVFVSQCATPSRVPLPGPPAFYGQGTGGLPAWLRLDAAAARFTVDGTRAPLGSHFVEVTGADPYGLRATTTVKVDVLATGSAPAGSSTGSGGGDSDPRILQLIAHYGTPALAAVVLALVVALTLVCRRQRAVAAYTPVSPRVPLAGAGVRPGAWVTAASGAEEGSGDSSVAAALAGSPRLPWMYNPQFVRGQAGKGASPPPPAVVPGSGELGAAASPVSTARPAGAAAGHDHGRYPVSAAVAGSPLGTGPLTAGTFAGARATQRGT